MEKNMRQAVADAIAALDLPEYSHLPDVGLYLEQTVQYLNQCLQPLGCVEVTGSMIRNYVKMGLVSNPVKKRYYAQHIAHLLPIVVLKQVLPLEQINLMFSQQRKVYSDEVAYNYFCQELKNILHWRFGLKPEIEALGSTNTLEKEMLRSAITAVSHVIFVNACLTYIHSEKN